MVVGCVFFAPDAYDLLAFFSCILGFGVTFQRVRGNEGAKIFSRVDDLT